MSGTTEGRPPFQGFGVPEQNWFKLPNEWTDITAGMKSLAELKVVEYVLRHTWGYQEYGQAKRISINEFMQGRRRADGRRLDQGTGLSNRSVIDGLRRAVADGYLIEEINDSDRGRVKKSYQLRMRGPEKHLQTDVKNLHGGVNYLHGRGEESSHRTEKDTSGRNFTVNGGNSPLRQLPDIEQPGEQGQLLAEDILAELGDEHSRRFYELVAAKVPEETIRRALAEIRADGADSPAKVFTHRMNRYAMERLKQRIGE